jgi:hypothetical protein
MGNNTTKCYFKYEKYLNVQSIHLKDFFEIECFVFETLISRLPVQVGSFLSFISNIWKPCLVSFIDLLPSQWMVKVISEKINMSVLSWGVFGQVWIKHLSNQQCFNNLSKS